MKKVLVVQLCRLGDILMTGPLLRGLRRDHPSAEISLMVMDSFAAAPLPAPDAALMAPSCPAQLRPQRSPPMIAPMTAPATVPPAALAPTSV